MTHPVFWWQDLVEAAEHIGWKRAVRAPGDKATNGDVRAQADFRNQAFLNRFISELGKLPPKRTTRLQQKTHRYLCRQIKVRYFCSPTFQYISDELTSNASVAIPSFWVQQAQGNVTKHLSRTI